MRLILPFAVPLLGLLAASAEAGVGNYPSPLYLAGPASSLHPSMNGSYRLIGNVPAAPTVTNTGAGTGPPAGTYRYVYTVDSGSGETASVSSASVTSTGNGILVGNLPTGVTVRIYRQNVGTPSNLFLVHTAVDNADSQFNDDNVSAPTDTGLTKKAENRVQSGLIPALCTLTQPCTGYFDFQTGVALPGTNNDDVTPFPPAGPTGKGWVVDGAGSVRIPAGPWTFTAQTKGWNATPPVPNGVARLVVAMWKVDGNGDAVGGPLLAPAEGTENLSTGTNVIQTITVTANVDEFSLGEDEHLYVQFWRRQTAQYTGGGPANRVVTMYLFDGVARIEHPGAVPDPALPAHVAPAAGATVSVWPHLSARFDDPVAGDTGTLGFQLCADSDCGRVLANGSVSGIANGATGSVTLPTGEEGTYYWRVLARDAGGGISAWSATRSFTYHVIDTTPPRLPGFDSPADGATTKTLPTLSVAYDDPDGGAGTIEVRVCTAAAPTGSECSGLASSGSMPVANGARAVFSSPLGEGEYHWQARALDTAGNASSWTATRSFTYDATPPSVPALERPAAAAVTTASPTVSARFESADKKGGTIEFRVCRSSQSAGSACAEVSASGSASVAASGQSASFTPSSLAGTYHWQARAVDGAGNQSSWTATRSFTVDSTPPSVPVLESPRDGFPSRVAPSLRARYDNPDGTAGTLELRVCADRDCATVLASTSASATSGGSASFAPALDDGDYHWQARALDGAGNASAWSPTRSVTYAQGLVGRGSDVPLVDVPVVADPLFGLAANPVTCRTNRRLAVRVVLRDPARVSLVLVQRSKPGARWRQVAVRRIDLGAGAHTVELRIAGRLRRDRRYELRVNVTAGAVKESRSLTVRIGDGEASPSHARSSVCNVAP